MRTIILCEVAATCLAAVVCLPAPSAPPLQRNPGVASRPEAATTEEHVGKGYSYLKDDLYQEAAAEFQAALDRDPTLARSRYQLAVCNFALGRRKAAREEFERVKTQTEDVAASNYYLGRIDLLEGDFASATRRLESVMKDPPFPDAAFYLGSAYLRRGDLAAAEQWLAHAAEADPRDFRAPDHLARVYQKEGREKEAERQYARSAELRQHYNDAAEQSIACSHALVTQTADQARPVCQRLFALDDPDKLTTLGMVYGQHGNYEDALRPLVRAAELDPESSEIEHNLGLTYFRLQRYAEARAPLIHAVALRPDFFGSNALLGATLYMLKDDEAAYYTLDHAHRLDPRDTDTADLLFRTATLLAEKELTRNNYKQSLEHLQRAEELRPADADVHRRLGRLYQLLGRAAEADSEVRKAKELERQPS